MMSAPKQPQDRKPKARPKTAAVAAEANQADFKFEHEGQTYLLPNATPYMAATDGGAFMDAMLESDGQGDVKLSMMALRNAKDDIDPEAYTALRSKSMPEFLAVVGEWLTSAAGVSVGESSGSST